MKKIALYAYGASTDHIPTQINYLRSVIVLHEFNKLLKGNHLRRGYY